jgi:hypothetical protein
VGVVFVPETLGAEVPASNSDRRTAMAAGMFAAGALRGFRDSDDRTASRARVFLVLLDAAP